MIEFALEKCFAKLTHEMYMTQFKAKKEPAKKRGNSMEFRKLHTQEQIEQS